MNLDRIKITCPLDEAYINLTGFSDILKSGSKVIKGKYPIDKEYNKDLNITYNLPTDSTKSSKYNGDLTIDINSNLLGHNYDEKINLNNIYKCLEKSLEITNQNIFSPEYVLKLGKSSLIHVTEDISMYLDSGQRKIISSLLIKPTKWDTTSKQNGTIWFSKLTDYRRGEKLKIYNKEHQMELKRRKEYMNKYNISNNKFVGKLRLEHELPNPTLIRKRLNITNNNVHSILTASTNPIVNFIQSNFKLEGDEYKRVNAEKLAVIEKLALMEKLGNHWPSIEQEIRRIKGSSPGNNAKKTVDVYKDIYYRYVRSDWPNGVNLLQQILSKLSYDNRITNAQWLQAA